MRYKDAFLLREKKANLSQSKTCYFKMGKGRIKTHYIERRKERKKEREKDGKSYLCA